MQLKQNLTENIKSLSQQIEEKQKLLDFLNYFPDDIPKEYIELYEFLNSIETFSMPEKVIFLDQKIKGVFDYCYTFVFELFGKLTIKKQADKPTLFFYGENVIMSYDIIEKTLYCSYNQIYFIFSILKVPDIKSEKTIKELISSYFFITDIKNIEYVRQHSIIDKIWSQLKINDISSDVKSSTSSENKKEEGEKFIDELFASLEQKTDEVKYPNNIFFFKENKVLAEYNTKNKAFYSHYKDIWLILKNNFNYTYDDYQELIKNKVEEHFNLKPSTTFFCHWSNHNSVEEHFNLKPSTT